GTSAHACLCTGDPNSCKTVFKSRADLDPRAFNRYLRRAGDRLVINRPPGTPASADPPPIATASNVVTSRFVPILSAFYRLRGRPTAPDRCDANLGSVCANGTACESGALCLAGRCTRSCSTDANCDTTLGERCLDAACRKPNNMQLQIGCLAAAVDCSIG